MPYLDRAFFLIPLMNKREILVSIFVFLILAPIIPVGLNPRAARVVIPDSVSYFCNIGCLFSKRTPQWSRYYIEGMTRQKEWIEIPEKDIFKIQPFGHRTRFTRIMVKFAKDKKVLPPLAKHIRKTFNNSTENQDLHISKVRFTRVIFQTAVDRAFPWPPLSEIPHEQRDIIYQDKVYTP